MGVHMRELTQRLAVVCGEWCGGVKGGEALMGVHASGDEYRLRAAHAEGRVGVCCVGVLVLVRWSVLRDAETRAAMRHSAAAPESLAHKPP
eukprot:457765-Rhodomonas_salina.1